MADNKKTKDILELEIQVKDRGSKKKIRELTHTMEELTEEQIRGGKVAEEYAKQFAKNLKAQESVFRNLAKVYKSQQKSTLDALRTQAKSIQLQEKELKLILKTIQAEDRKGKSTSDENKQKDNKQKEEIKKLKQKTKAIKDNNREKAKGAKSNKDTEGYVRFNKGSKKGSKGEKGSKTGFQLPKLLQAADSLSSGYSRSGYQGIVKTGLEIGGKASKKIGSIGKELQAAAKSGALGPQLQMAGAAEKLTAVFGKLSTAVGLATRFLGAFASFLMVAIEADAKQKEMNRKVSSKMGSATMMGGDMMRLNASIVDKAIENSPLRLGGLRLNTEELADASNALFQSGVNIKNLVGGFKDFNSILDTTAVVSRNFGVEMGEAAGMVGDYFNSFGAGAETIKDTFATLNQDIKTSSMTTNQFLATINSVSAQFNLFIDQTKEFSQLLGQMSKGGGLSTKQINKFMQTLAGFGPHTVDEGIKTMALFGPQIQQNAKRDISDLETKLKTKKYDSEAERGADLRRLENLRVVAKGGINAGTAVKDAMGSMGIVESVLKKKGIQTFDQMRDAKNNLQLVKVLAASTGKSDEEVQDMLEAASSLMENSKQTFSELMKKNREELKKAADSQTARREAQEYAQQTVTKLSGLQDVGNALLLTIAEILTKLYNKVAKYLGFGFGEQIEAPNLTESKGKLTKQIEEMKEWYSNFGTGPTQGAPQSSAYVSNMAKRTLGSKVDLPPIKGTTFPAGATPSPAGTAASKLPAGGAAGVTGGAGAKSAPIHMEAVLVLPNEKPIELIVNKVLYKKGSRQ